MTKEAFDQQAGLDWYNQLIIDGNAKDELLATKDAEIKRLRGLLLMARDNALSGYDRDAIARTIDAGISISPAPDPAEWDEIGDRDVGFMRVPRAPDPAERLLSECDCCGEMKPDCEDVVYLGMDTHACAQCRDCEEC